jgi:hypothetical protein
MGATSGLPASITISYQEPCDSSIPGIWRLEAPTFCVHTRSLSPLGCITGGVFVNPASSAAPAKLRLVYECAPLAFISEVGPQ